MKLTAAIVREQQGGGYVVVRVGDHVLHHPTLRSELLGFARQSFGLSAALMSGRTGRTFGPPGVIERLRRVPPDRLPWREYEINQ